LAFADGNRHPPQPRTAPDTEGNRTSPRSCWRRDVRRGWAPNKLLRTRRQELVRIVAEQALASKASEVIVVTGHQAELIEQALAGLKVKFVRNPDFAGGLASSVKSGHCGGGTRMRRRADLPGRHAADIGAIDRPADRTFAPDRGQ